MANKFEVNGQILTITDTITNKTLVKSPKADLFYYIEALEATIPSIKLYDISGANSSGGATTFYCLLSTAVDSSNTPFTVSTFKTFADSNLGFKSASLETDPIFGASEAALFVSGDKAKLDNTWLKSGNAGTNPATNFIGTTDVQDVIFKRNNTEYFRLVESLGNTTQFRIGINMQKEGNIGNHFVYFRNGSGGIGYDTNNSLITNVNNVMYLNTSDSGKNLVIAVAGVARHIFAADANARTGLNTLNPTKTLDINGELRIRTLPTGLSTENILVVNGSGDVRSINPNSLFIDKEIPSGAINGVNTIFTLANTPVLGSEHLYRNGILQEVGAGNDYTISGATITFLTAPLTGNKIRVTYRR